MILTINLYVLLIDLSKIFI